MWSNFESTLSNMSTHQLHELKSKVTNTIQIPFAIREMLSIKLILRVIIPNRLRHQITNKLKELWTKSASTACNKGSTLNVEMSLIIVYLVIFSSRKYLQFSCRWFKWWYIPYSYWRPITAYGSEIEKACTRRESLQFDVRTMLRCRILISRFNSMIVKTMPV